MPKNTNAPPIMMLKIKNLRFQVTRCEEFPQGNFIGWETTNWFLNSSRGTVFSLIMSRNA